MKPRIFIVIGPSGSGKGTQAKLLKDYLEKNDSREVKYFQTGQAFRDLAAKDSYTAKLLANVMTTGNLVPIFLPVWAWTNFFVKEYTGEEHLILDGLARREKEAPILDSAAEFYGVEHIDVLFINTSDEWSRQRLLNRGRGDDHDEEIDRRLAWFKENTMPAVEYFRSHEQATFHEINGEQTIEEVHEEVVRSLDLS